MPKILQPLRHRDFALLLGGQTLSWVGNNFYEIAIMWLVLQTTGSTAAMAGVAAISAIPQLTFAPIAGVVADRLNRRVMALSMDLCRGVVILVLPTLDVTHHLAAWQVYITAFVMFTLFTFFIPARQAILPNVVPDEELPAANALFQIVLSSSLFIGFALGGVVVALVGVVPALYLDSISFAASVLSLLFMKTNGRSAAPAEKTGALREAIAGIRFVRSNPRLLTMFSLIGVTSLLVGPLLILPAPFSAHVLHAGAQGYGALEGSFMLGGVIGAIIAGSIANYRRIGLALLAGLIGIGVLIAGVSLTVILPAAVGLYLLAGVIEGIIGVPMQTLMQRLTPDAMRGRVLTTTMIVNSAGLPLSIAIGGIAAQQLGPAEVYLIVGLGMAALAVVFFFTPLRTLESVSAATSATLSDSRPPGELGLAGVP